MPYGNAVIAGSSGVISTLSIGQPVGRITATILIVGTNGSPPVSPHVHLTCDGTDPVSQTAGQVMDNTTQTLPNVLGQSIVLVPPISGGQPSRTVVKLLSTTGANGAVPSVLLEW